MAAKSILNEFYQRLRIAAPVYKTEASDGTDGFLCTLLLPAVQADNDALHTERVFEGQGNSKKVRAWVDTDAELLLRGVFDRAKRTQTASLMVACCLTAHSCIAALHPSCTMAQPSITLLHNQMAINSLQEAEHAAANAAVQFLQSEGLLRADSQTSSTSASTPVGSKRSKDLEDDEPGMASLFASSCNIRLMMFSVLSVA